MPTCANLNFSEGLGSRVRWHSDNDGLFGKQENPNSMFQRVLEPRRFSNGDLGLVWTVTLALPGCTMVTFWSWMVVVRMSIFTVRNPCRGERVKSLFGGSESVLPRCPLATGVVCCLATCAKGSLVSSNADSFLPDFLLSVVLLTLLGWGAFLFWLPFCHLVLDYFAGLRAASVCLAGCGAGLVDAVLDRRTLGVSTTVGFI